MKSYFTLLIIFFAFPFYFAQNDSVDCNKINRYEGFIAVESMPEIIGGLDSLQARVRYPAEALKKNISGKVYVLVYVDTLGMPRCTKILKGLGYGCDEEAIRLIKTSRYTPAYQRGRKFAVEVSIPIYFKPPENK